MKYPGDEKELQQFIFITVDREIEQMCIVQ